MGRGAGTGRLSAGGGAGAKSIDINGDKIDLSASPLVYGNKDSALTKEVRSVIDAWEEKRVKNKIEFNVFVMNDGTIIRENKGGKGSVKGLVSDRQTADVLSHNHPREEGVLGGTFSTADMSNFVNYHQTTYRATAKEGTYSISKGSNFKKDDFIKAFREADKTASEKLSAQHKELNKKYYDGKIAKENYGTQLRDYFNARLVESHNWLLANQGKYGYSYTLERR